MSEHAQHPYRIYWGTWVFLLIVTAVMLWADSINMARWVMVPFLCAFMMLKAVMIGGNFMHLRFEVRTLGYIALTPLVIGTLLLLVLMPDSVGLGRRTADSAKIAAPTH